MLDAGKPSFTPKKGKPSIVMFVGLQGISVLNIFGQTLLILLILLHETINCK